MHYRIYCSLEALAKTCYFRQCLDTALHDQFVCGLNNRQCQRELLSMEGLTLQTALQKVTATETATMESRSIHGASAEGILNKDCTRCLSNPSAIVMVRPPTTLHSASTNPINVTIVRRLDIWLQHVAQSLLTDETRIRVVIELGPSKRLLTVIRTTVVIALDACIISYS